MTVRDHFRQIESMEFAIRANLASGATGFIDAISSGPAFNDLLEEAKLQSDIISAVLQRIRLLASSKVDHRYENPNDVALATYTWLLSECVPDVAKIAAAVVLDAHQIWWARHIASHILESDVKLKASHSTQSIFISYSGPPPAGVANVQFMWTRVSENNISVSFGSDFTTVWIAKDRYIAAPEFAGSLWEDVSWGEFEGITRKVAHLASVSLDKERLLWNREHG